MQISILAVGKLKEREVRSLVDDYLGRIRRYCRCDEIEVKDDAALLKAVPKDATLVAMEVKGRALSSSQFAEKLENFVSMGKGHVVFVIGGAEGIPEELSNSAQLKLSLSTMTLPHRLARLLLSGQIYRGFSILRNEPYARED